MKKPPQDSLCWAAGVIEHELRFARSSDEHPKNTYFNATHPRIADRFSNIFDAGLVVPLNVWAHQGKKEMFGLELTPDEELKILQWIHSTNVLTDLAYGKMEQGINRLLYPKTRP